MADDWIKGHHRTWYIKIKWRQRSMNIKIIRNNMKEGWEKTRRTMNGKIEESFLLIHYLKNSGESGIPCKKYFGNWDNWMPDRKESLIRIQSVTCLYSCHILLYCLHNIAAAVKTFNYFLLKKKTKCSVRTVVSSHVYLFVYNCSTMNTTISRFQCYC
jgi:hypothetical protein